MGNGKSNVSLLFVFMHFLLGVTSAVIGDREHFGNCGDESVSLT